MLLGCIADDLTGASDLALMLTRGGLSTVLAVGVPSGELPEAQAVVVALKSRTIPADAAVAQSLAALDRLKAAGAVQVFFKYCSTFDSTPDGNIGPVADALLEALGADFTIACPAFPANRRTVYLGHLFVGDALLSDSPMRDHPLTPMTESSLVSILARQTPHKVGLVAYPTVREGAGAIRAAFEELRAAGVCHAVVDALDDRHLLEIGRACAGLALVTGGSGVAMGLPANLGARAGGALAPLERVEGHAAVLAGSCAPATLAQIAAMKAQAPAFALDPLQLAAGADEVSAAIAWARPRLKDGPVLIYASAAPETVAAVQARLGRSRSGEIVEQALAGVARGLVAEGVRKLVVAGGETAGAVVEALGLAVLRIGPEIDTGVPWTSSLTEPRLLLALKSGNFGSPDVFLKAFRSLP